MPLACLACGHDELSIAEADGDADLVCLECEERVGPRCPGCGGTDLVAVLDRDRQRPVSECIDWDEQFGLTDV